MPRLISNIKSYQNGQIWVKAGEPVTIIQDKGHVVLVEYKGKIYPTPKSNLVHEKREEKLLK